MPLLQNSSLQKAKAGAISPVLSIKQVKTRDFEVSIDMKRESLNQENANSQGQQQTPNVPKLPFEYN